MKKNVGYRIDYANATVTVTKKFMEAAGIIGTLEFEQRKVLADMGLTIKVRETKPAKSNKVTYAQMRRYIALVEDSAKYLNLFELVLAEAKSKKDAYNRVLKWFHATFPRFYDMPEFNAASELIVKPTDYPAANEVLELYAIEA